MAKANAASGATVYVAEGAPDPGLGPDVRLVGPGAEPEGDPVALAEDEPEVVDAEPEPESAPEVEAPAEEPVDPTEPPAESEPAGADSTPRRPAVNDPKADWVAWAIAVGYDPITTPELTKAELQALQP